MKSNNKANEAKTMPTIEIGDIVSINQPYGKDIEGEVLEIIDEMVGVLAEWGAIVYAPLTVVNKPYTLRAKFRNGSSRIVSL